MPLSRHDDVCARRQLFANAPLGLLRLPGSQLLGSGRFIFGGPPPPLSQDADWLGDPIYEPCN